MAKTKIDYITIESILSKESDIVKVEKVKEKLQLSKAKIIPFENGNYLMIGMLDFFAPGFSKGLSNEEIKEKYKNAAIQFLEEEYGNKTVSKINVRPVIVDELSKKYVTGTASITYFKNL